MASVVLATPDSLSSSITSPLIPSGPFSLSSYSSDYYWLHFLFHLSAEDILDGWTVRFCYGVDWHLVILAVYRFDWSDCNSIPFFIDDSVYVVI